MLHEHSVGAEPGYMMKLSAALMNLGCGPLNFIIGVSLKFVMLN